MVHFELNKFNEPIWDKPFPNLSYPLETQP